MVELNNKSYVAELNNSRMSVSNITTIDESTIRVKFTESITSSEVSLATFFRLYDGGTIVHGNYTSQESSEANTHFQEVQTTDINGDELTLRLNPALGESFNSLPITTQLRGDLQHL